MSDIQAIPLGVETKASAHGWRLSTVGATRRRLAGIIRDYYLDDKADGARFRNMVYGFSVLLSAFQAEYEQDLMRRVEALEAKATDEQHPGA